MKRNLHKVVIVVIMIIACGFLIAQAKESLVNINTADETALTTLIYIGKSRAKAIIAYRDQNGPFKSIEALKDVSGVGDRVFESIKDKITVDDK